MKKSLITMSMLLLITVVAFSQDLTGRERAQVYNIDAPRGWAVTSVESGYESTIYSEPKGRSFITVTTFKREGVERKAYNEQFLRNFSQELGMELKESETATVNNAYVYKAELGDSKRECSLVVYHRHNEIYVVVAAAQKRYYKKNKNQLTRVTNSFSVTN